MSNSKKLWVIYNIPRKLYHAEDYDEAKNLVEAKFFTSFREAKEEREQLCVDELTAMDREVTNDDFSHWDRWAPAGWDFERDGEVEGNKLSGPWVLKKVTLTLED